MSTLLGKGKENSTAKFVPNNTPAKNSKVNFQVDLLPSRNTVCPLKAATAKSYMLYGQRTSLQRTLISLSSKAHTCLAIIQSRRLPYMLRSRERLFKLSNRT